MSKKGRGGGVLPPEVMKVLNTSLPISGNPQGKKGVSIGSMLTAFGGVGKKPGQISRKAAKDLRDPNLVSKKGWQSIWSGAGTAPRAKGKFNG